MSAQSPAMKTAAPAWLRRTFALAAPVLVTSAAILLYQRYAAGGRGASPGLPAAAAPSAARPPAQAPLPVDVHVAAAERLDLSMPATGTLLAQESVDVVSELSRRLVKVRAGEGTQVEKGALLFELDSADLGAQLARLEVQKKLARLTLTRQDKLRGEQLSSQEDWEQARARLDEIEAEARILAVTLDRTRIRAPFSGTLGLRRVSEGAWVTPQTVITTLQDTSRLKLDFQLPERVGDGVKAGQSFSFTVDGRGERLSGTVVAVEPVVQETTRSVLVRGVVDNKAGLLPGTFANVALSISASDALLVPSIAVVPSVKGRSVYVVRDGVARSVEVKLGARTPDRVQILSGVAPGDKVVTTNLLRLRDGAPVAVR
jgi:membrane fusion protein, multidrug efflux system